MNSLSSLAPSLSLSRFLSCPLDFKMRLMGTSPACDYINVDIGENPITSMERTIDYYAELKTGDAEISGRK